MPVMESPDDNRVTVRFPKHMYDRLEEYAERNDLSMSEAVREAVDNKLDTDGPPADDSRLGKAKRAMDRAADPSGRIPVKVAEARIAEAVGMRKADVRRAVIGPLRERGEIELIDFGVLKV